MDFKIQQEASSSKGRFYIEKEGTTLAEMTYSVAGSSKIIIDHTEVDDSLRGEGVGDKLLKALIEYVRKENIKVLPLCPFAKARIEKTEEYQDVLF
ncbi:GNAT family N-acetyltransferase [Galbibacter mesophilus]|uniref:GNAT family N-acetyltransferase n=1 Tax=Galbibacter mesophilus TaxID=379069 RepID=UPI00192027CC|nr:GNAT family N-acetyltransferase [Galbibacter mesophilus]MCM5663848.1 N-acetyltransferase [Galbibacter mesophilus]